MVTHVRPPPVKWSLDLCASMMSILVLSDFSDVCLGYRSFEFFAHYVILNCFAAKVDLYI